jgi:hypothetical protein
LRIPSLNALEGDLKESDFQKLIGRKPTPEVKAFSADVVANVLDQLQLGGVRRALAQVIAKAERGHRWLGALRLLRSPLPAVFGAPSQSQARRG